jgi:hypothetical protein
VAAGMWLLILAVNVGRRPERFAFMVCRKLGFLELTDGMETGAF